MLEQYLRDIHAEILLCPFSAVNIQKYILHKLINLDVEQFDSENQLYLSVLIYHITHKMLGHRMYSGCF